MESNILILSHAESKSYNVTFLALQMHLRECFFFRINYTYKELMIFINKII